MTTAAMSPYNSVFVFMVLAGFLLSPVAGGQFQPPCNSNSYPSVAWTDAPAGQTATFTLKSSTRLDATNNWVSFGFASAQSMTSTLVVVDCIDLNGNLSTSTSKNLAGDNIDDPADLPKVTARTITFNQGVYTCTFNMTLPNVTVYAIIAEGKMDQTSTPPKSPKKRYHGKWRYASNTTFTFGGAARNAGQFTPTACGTAPFPGITWTDAPAGQTTKFTLTSSMRTDSMNNWVSFGFASMPTMTSTLVVVDCFDLNGNLSTSTSKNLAGDNVDLPTDLPKVTARTLTFNQGVYTCTFNMMLPSTTVYAIVAEGKMDPKSNLAVPRKFYHGNARYWSNSTFTFAAGSGVAQGPRTPLVVATAIASVLASSLRQFAGR